MDVGTIANLGASEETKMSRPIDPISTDSDLSPNGTNKLKQATRTKRSAGDEPSLDGAASETSNGSTSPGAPPPLKKKTPLTSGSSAEPTSTQSKDQHKPQEEAFGDDAAALLLGFADSVLQERPSGSSPASTPMFGSPSSATTKTKNSALTHNSGSPNSHSVAMPQSSPLHGALAHHGLGDMTPVSANHPGGALFGVFNGTFFIHPLLPS